MDSEKAYFERWRCVFSFFCFRFTPSQFITLLCAKREQDYQRTFHFRFTAEQSFDILRGDWKMQGFKVLRFTVTKLYPLFVWGFANFSKFLIFFDNTVISWQRIIASYDSDQTVLNYSQLKFTFSSSLPNKSQVTKDINQICLALRPLFNEIWTMT